MLKTKSLKLLKVSQQQRLVPQKASGLEPGSSESFGYIHRFRGERVSAIPEVGILVCGYLTVVLHRLTLTAENGRGKGE